MILISSSSHNQPNEKPNHTHLSIFTFIPLYLKKLNFWISIEFWDVGLCIVLMYCSRCRNMWKIGYLFLNFLQMRIGAMEFCGIVLMAILLVVPQGVFGIRFVIDREECFSHNVQYEGDTVHVSFVVIKVDSSWYYSQDGVDLVVSIYTYMSLCIILFIRFCCNYVLGHQYTLCFQLWLSIVHFETNHCCLLSELEFYMHCCKNDWFLLLFSKWLWYRLKWSIDMFAIIFFILLHDKWLEDVSYLNYEVCWPFQLWWLHCLHQWFQMLFFAFKSFLCFAL